MEAKDFNFSAQRLFSAMINLYLHPLPKHFLLNQNVLSNW